MKIILISILIFLSLLHSFSGSMQGISATFFFLVEKANSLSALSIQHYPLFSDQYLGPQKGGINGIKDRSCSLTFSFNFLPLYSSI